MIVSRRHGCLDTLEKTEHYLWGPIAKQTVTNPKVDAFSVQQLFFIAKQMLGDRRWIPMYMMMDAVAAVMGFKNPYQLESKGELESPSRRHAIRSRIPECNRV